MKKISDNVSISWGEFRINDLMLEEIARRLSGFLKIFIKEVHGSGFRIDNGGKLPNYTKRYLRFKAKFLGVAPSSVTPDLELHGELHDGALTGYEPNSIGYDSIYELSPEGFEHMTTPESVKIWETLRTINVKYWDNDIMPFVESIMDKFRDRMLESSEASSGSFDLF